MQLWVSGFFCVLFVFSKVFASGPSDTRYDQLSETELRDILKEETTRNHHAIGYDRARIELMGKLYLDRGDQGYFIHDVYCEQDFDKTRFHGGPGPAPGVVPDPKVINTEHTWPQSRFGGVSRDFQKSDLHHLFPSDTQMNSNRGNSPFGEVVKATVALKCPISTAGANKDGDFVFEPPVGHRGNVARALFYFAVRYKLHIDPTQERALRKWHEQDPVTDQDRERNDEIEALQGNRNPFIDHPELAARISDY